MAGGNAPMNKYTAKRAEFVFGQPMKPCPKCGDYEIKWQTPIKAGVVPGDSVKQMVAKWARANREGAMLEGPIFLRCFACGHDGPSVDCTGRSRDDVGRDLVVAAEVKRLWNSQETKP